jgi:hypothetical protein
VVSCGVGGRGWAALFMIVDLYVGGRLRWKFMFCSSSTLSTAMFGERDWLLGGVSWCLLVLERCGCGRRIT